MHLGEPQASLPHLWPTTQTEQLCARTFDAFGANKLVILQIRVRVATYVRIRFALVQQCWLAIQHKGRFWHPIP